MNWEGPIILLGAIALWLWASYRYMVRPTQGTPIEPRPGAALLLVDLQTVYWRDDTYDAQTRARVEAAVAREAALAQHRNQPVIAVRQEWSGIGPRLIAWIAMKGHAVKASPGTELAAPFAGQADHVVTKRVQDGFETGELDVVLRVLRVGHLRIAGLDGTGSVARTAQAAINRGYEVTLVSDAIATARKTDFDTVRDSLASQGAQVI